MRLKKSILTYLIYILYTIALLVFMIYLRNSYNPSTSQYEATVFMGLILAYLGIAVLTGPYLSILTSFIIAGGYGLYNVAQQVYYRAFGQYFRFSTAISLKKEVKDSAGSVIELIKISDVIPFVILIVFTIVVIVVYILCRHKIKHIAIKSIIHIVLGCIVVFVGYNKLNSFVTLIESKSDEVDAFQIYQSDYYIYDSMPTTIQFVDTFGITTFLYKDTYNTFTVNSDNQQYVSDIEQYFADKQKPQTNDYTGIFAGKNLFIIQAESLMNIAIDEKLTPTLYKLYNQGIVVEDFNTPALPGSTSDTEFMANTSLVPQSDGYSCSYRYGSNTYPTTLAKLFTKQGYYSYAFHNNYGDFYNRTNIFANFGYDFYDSYKLGLVDEDPDSVVLNVAQWTIIEENPILAYWISFNGHQPYNMEYDDCITQYEDIVRETYPDLDDQYVSYFCKNMDFDQSLATMIANLEYAGKLDDFVFIIFGDHIAKGIGDDAQVKQVEQAIGYTSEQDATHTPLIIYNSATQPSRYKKISTSLDLLPTIANLFNIDYDYKTTLGHDIFDDSYEGFFFNEWGDYDTNNFYYNSIEDIYYSENNYPKEKAMVDVSTIDYMRSISKKILITDYFATK